MDAIFIDQAGHKKNFLYQYDVGQSFIIEKFEYSNAPKVQFSIKSIKTSPSVSSRLNNGTLSVTIPDMLLTYGEDVIAYLYIQDATQGTIIETVFISVIPRKRPADYQYTSEMFARTVNGTTISEDSSFGEVAVWSDENPNREKRYGYFVTASYGSNSIVINKASSINNVYGVAVNNVGFAANCTESKLDAAGNLLPKYDYVCTAGFAEVIDNGRCTVGGMCIPNTDGTARTPTNTIGYKVIARTDSSHIIIFVDVSMQTVDGLQTSINNLNSNLSAHKNNKSNPHEVTKAQVGLGNCDNTSDIDKPISTAQANEFSRIENLVNSAQSDIDAHEAKTDNPHSVTKAQVGLSEVPNVDTNDQTPTYTESSTLTQLTSGEKLSIAFGKLSKAVADFISHLANKSNPHSVTKAQVGLGNCDDTSDVDKPVSTAQAAEIARVEGLANNAQNDVDTHSAKTDNPHSVTKAQVGLGNCDNTSDVDKPISTAQSVEFTRLEGLITAAQGDTNGHSARTDNPHNVTAEQIGLGNCDNTSDINKPISTATQAALDKKADLDSNGLVPLSQLPSQVKEMRVVETIAERDAITDKFVNLRVYVKDATGDSTVKSGGADYLYDGSKWIKTGEVESLDLVLSWDNVTGIPTDYIPSAHASTHATGGTDVISPSDIGAAVADHTHDASVVPIIDEVTGTKYYFKMINGGFGLYAENSDVNVLNGDNTSY